MGFKVRGYTRDVPQEKVRDYSLFAIATEGTEREPDYFRLFDGIDRIKVDIIEPEVSDEENAQQADTNPDGYMPELLQTKVYQLGRALYERMGKVRFENFVASLPSIEQKILKQKKK